MSIPVMDIRITRQSSHPIVKAPSTTRRLFYWGAFGRPPLPACNPPTHCQSITHPAAGPALHEPFTGGMGRHQNASELLSARVWELEHQNQEALQANLELHQQCTECSLLFFACLA